MMIIKNINDTIHINIWMYAKCYDKIHANIALRYSGITIFSVFLTQKVGTHNKKHLDNMCPVRRPAHAIWAVIAMKVRQACTTLGLFNQCKCDYPIFQMAWSTYLH